MAQAQAIPGKFDQLLSQVDSLDTFDNGYDLRVKGDAATIRALVDELSAAASCCSPLSFNVRRSARRRSRAHHQHGGQPTFRYASVRLLQLIARMHSALVPKQSFQCHSERSEGLQARRFL